MTKNPCLSAWIRGGILFLLVGFAALAGEAEVREDVRYLASDALEGRATGSAGEKAAADHISKRLREAGLEPERREFDFTAGVGAGPKTALAFDIKGERIPVALGQDGFTPLGFSSNGRVEGAGVVFCGYGITAPELVHDDYRDVEVGGKVAIVLDRLPGGGGGRFKAEAARYGQVRYKVMNARERGAAAVLVVSSQAGAAPGDDPSLLPISAGAHGDAGVLVADVRRGVARDLLERAGRSLDALQAEIERDAAPRSVALDGVGATIEVDLLKDRRRAANVVAVRRGADPELTREAIVLGAHYDHLGRGEVGGSLSAAPPGAEIHNGADDNASGTAALLEVARALPKTRRTVVFAAFTGEEMGLLGSADYVKRPPVPIDGTVAMINMDMVGRLGPGGKLTVGGMGTAAEWPEVVSAAARRTGIEFAARDDGYGPSDHSSFYSKEVPVLFLFTGAHPEYHTERDDPELVDVTGTARVAGFARELVLAIDALEARPAHRKTQGDPHAMGRDVEPGRGPQVYLGTIPDYSTADEVAGVRLTGVRDGSPAEQAGLRGGDVIVRFDGKEIRNVHDYTYALFAKRPGDEVEIVVRRGAEEVVLRATLGRKGRP